ncbi:MAG TPA: DNA primase, partial [Solirubrobacterales bacterium]|nr:DNA primase [Solirubrobacterales bacterium]
KLVDRVAYINHDIDDALRAGILRAEDLPADEIALLGPTGSKRIDTLVADIVEVISAYTDLRRAGTRYTGLCPFHDERTPSFSVDPTEKLYHCFGCGVGGDVIKFVEEKEGLGFPEAVEALSERYGVELEREHEDPRQEEMRKKRARLGELLERTANFYSSFLWDSPQAAKAREYLAGRGLSDEVLREFGVGCAPGTWDTVLLRGQQAGYSVAEIEAAGLVRQGQKGRGHYDQFRSRIIFPIRDARGRVNGFGGRALHPDQKPKYVNSPEGELYSKRRTLYGIDRARAAIAKGSRAVVVEGYTDVLACHQAGITNAVAVMGTAITPEQVKLLSAYAEEAVLALDADRAGREAMLRAQGVASGKRLRLRVARMPEGEDPADLLGGGEKAATARFREAIEAAEDLPSFHVRTLLEDADLGSPGGRDRALDEVVDVIAAMPDSITREELMREVADRLDADPGLVARRVRGAGRGTARDAGPPRGAEDTGEGAPATAPRQLSARERRELALLAMCVASPAEGRGYLERLTAQHFSLEVAGRAHAWLLAHLDDPMQGLGHDDEELLGYVTQVVMQSEREPAGREAIELNYLELERGLLERQIAAAQPNGGKGLVELQKKRAQLAERIARAGGV